MNYYERHIGDLIKDTVHLSMLEDGAYNRLIDQYYTLEKPLPADFKKVCRLARAQTKAERDAVATVLAEFFELREDGYHQKRCDEEIAEYLAGEPDREAKKQNANERQRKTRERRAAIFEALAEHGIYPEWNASMTQLKTLLSRVTSRDESQPVTCDVTATRHQTPDTSNNSLSPAHDDIANLPGLAGYHPIDWQPDLAKLSAYLQSAGIPSPDNSSLANSLTRFNLNFQGRALTESQRYSRLLTWITGDYRREQNQQQRTPSSGSSAPDNRPAARKLTPAEQIEHDCRELQRQSGARG